MAQTSSIVSFYGVGIREFHGTQAGIASNEPAVDLNLTTADGSVQATDRVRSAI